MAFDAGAIEAELTLGKGAFIAGIAEAKRIAARGITIPVRFDVSQAAVTRALTAARAMFRASPIAMPIRFDVSAASVARAVTAARAFLRATPVTVPLQLSISNASMIAIGTQIRAFFAAHPITIPLRLSVSATAAAAAGAAAAAAATGGAAAAAGAGAAAGGGGRGGRGFFGFLGGLAGRAPIPLFGGAFSAIPIIRAIGAVHLLSQSILEVAATLIPAGIAFGAFGAAASGPVSDIYSRMVNLHTVVTATGQSLYPFGNQLTRIQNAVRPQVMLLFGDALTIAGAKTGAFARLAQQGGTALDTLGARFTFAMTHGQGFSEFLKNSGADLLGWGTLVGNLGGILGNVLKQLPGYARYLLNFAVGVTHVAESITGSGVGQGIIGAGLAAHGALIYMGLGVTIASAALRGGLTVVGNWAEKAGMAFLATNRLGTAGLAAGRGLLGLSAGAASAAALPWGWILIAAAGIGFLAYKMITAKSAAQQWVASLNQAIAATSVMSGMETLVSDASLVASRLSEARRAIAHATTHETWAGQQTGPSLDQLSALGAYTREQQTLSDQTALFRYRLGRLGVMYGGVTAATGLLTAAGIKMSQMLDTSQWPQILQQVQAVINAYTAMGQRSGVLGADMNALTIAGSDQVKAMTQLNSAWDTTISIVSGGQDAFITFEQGLLALPALLAKTGASMTGINAPSLALRAAWQGAFADAAKLADAARMMQAGGATGLPLTRVLKDMVAGLIPAGKQSAATRAELVALAQEVNPLVRNWQQLVRWLGNTRNAQEQLNKIMARSGTTIQNLARDAANLAGVMHGQITAAFSRSKLSSSGFNLALSHLTDAMKTNANTSPVVQKAALALYYVLVNKLKMGAQTAAAMVDTLTGSIIKVPKNHNTNFTTSGIGAAMSQVQAYLALLSQAQGFAQSQISGGLGVLKHSPPGAHPLVPGPPPSKTGGALTRSTRTSVPLAPLIGSVSFIYQGSGDTTRAMNDLLFTLRHARQSGYAGVPAS